MIDYFLVDRLFFSKPEQRQEGPKETFAPYQKSDEEEIKDTTAIIILVDIHIEAHLVTQSIPAIARRRKRTRVTPPTILF